MSILQELTALLSPILPVETGMFSGVPPNEYLVLTPMADEFPLFGDNAPLLDVAEVRISLFSKGNYINRKNQIIAWSCRYRDHSGLRTRRAFRTS